jgi:uncharacterized membrane protein YfcA
MTLLLFLAGLAGGAVNTLAGGGSFITFPALLAAGVPPIVANASNTFASTAGYLSGAWSLRRAITDGSYHLWGTTLLSAFCGVVGALLLTKTSNVAFERVIPWLLMFATALFIWGNQLNKHLMTWSTHSNRHGAVRLGFFALLALIAVYGGFFNAGLGILLLSYTSLAGYRTINEMNALKLLYSSTISCSAIGIFLWHGLIQWQETLSLLTGTLVGGYAAGALSTRIPAAVIRTLIIGISVAVTAYFFYQQR